MNLRELLNRITGKFPEGIQRPAARTPPALPLRPAPTPDQLMPIDSWKPLMRVTRERPDGRLRVGDLVMADLTRTGANPLGTAPDVWRIDETSGRAVKGYIPMGIEGLERLPPADEEALRGKLRQAEAVWATGQKAVTFREDGFTAP